jgi:hypothetical protein
VFVRRCYEQRIPHIVQFICEQKDMAIRSKVFMQHLKLAGDATGELWAAKVDGFALASRMFGNLTLTFSMSPDDPYLVLAVEVTHRAGCPLEVAEDPLGMAAATSQQASTPEIKKAVRVLTHAGVPSDAAEQLFCSIGSAVRRGDKVSIATHPSETERP